MSENKSIFTHKLNKGSLFTNKYKNKETQPDWKGSININGEQIKLAAWKSTTKAGDPMLSLKVDDFVPQPQEGNAAQAAVQNVQDAQAAVDVDSIPF